LVATSKDVVSVWQFFEKLIYIKNMVDNSVKCGSLYNSQVIELACMLAIDELETGQGTNQICTLK
jgi:hypothetical protein